MNHIAILSLTIGGILLGGLFLAVLFLAYTHSHEHAHVQAHTHAPEADAAAASPDIGSEAADAAAVTESPPFAIYYGGGLRAGDRVTASIGDNRCGRASADVSGAWISIVTAGGYGGAARSGAEVTIRWVDGERSATTAWRPGDMPQSIVLAARLPDSPREAASPREAHNGEYVVQTGDSVWSIAQALAPQGTDWEDFANRIADLNGLGPASTLRIGQVLRIPQP